MSRVTEKAQHTPGPWHISDHISKGLILSSPGRSVARVMRDDQDPEVTEANARLIAAAPALLEALRDMVTGCEMQGIRLLGHNKARAVIAQAEGRDK